MPAKNTALYQSTLSLQWKNKNLGKVFSEINIPAYHTHNTKVLCHLSMEYYEIKYSKKLNHIWLRFCILSIRGLPLAVPQSPIFFYISFSFQLDIVMSASDLKFKNPRFFVNNWLVRTKPQEQGFALLLSI